VSDCDRLESTLQAYVSGELDESGLGPLFAHCRGCEACRHLLELHRDLLGLAARAPQPDQADLDALQARVLGRIARPERASVPPAGPRPGGPFWTLRFGAARVAAAAASVVLLVATGLFLGRFLPTHPAAHGSVTNELLEAMSADAASNRDLTDVEDSRFTYSNVSFRRVDADRVALDFDVTTHVQVVRPTQSELVRDVLVQSLLTASSVGSRLKAMSYATGAIDPKVREALIFALRGDENLAVRLEALTILSDHLQEQQVENAVLAAVRADESVQVRLLALDYLVAHHFDRGRIREVIEERQRPGNEALLVRLAEYEKKT